MAKKLPKQEEVSLDELVVSHAYEMLALVTVLERKNILTRQCYEIIEVIKELNESVEKD